MLAPSFGHITSKLLARFHLSVIPAEITHFLAKFLSTFPSYETHNPDSQAMPENTSSYFSEGVSRSQELCLGTDISQIRSITLLDD